MKNIPKKKLEMISILFSVFFVLLCASWEYIDVKINRSDYTEVFAEITDIDTRTTTSYRKGRRRRRTSSYLTVKYMYEGEYRYATGISKSFGEHVGDTIKLYARADGVVRRGTIPFDFMIIFIITMVFVVAVKMLKENQEYTPIPSHPRGMIVDDNFYDSNYNHSGNYGSMSGNYNSDLNSSYGNMSGNYNSDLNSSYGNMSDNYNSDLNGSYGNMNDNYNSDLNSSYGNMNDNYNNDMNNSYTNEGNSTYNNNLNSNYNGNLSVETQDSEHRIKSQQKEEIPQGMRVIEIPEKYL